eukprot:1445948-Pyramimonas_sp.AAC.1
MVARCCSACQKHGRHGTRVCPDALHGAERWPRHTKPQHSAVAADRTHEWVRPPLVITIRGQFETTAQRCMVAVAGRQVAEKGGGLGRRSSDYAALN